MNQYYVSKDRGIVCAKYKGTLYIRLPHCEIFATSSGIEIRTYLSNIIIRYDTYTHFKDYLGVHVTKDHMNDETTRRADDGALI